MQDSGKTIAFQALCEDEKCTGCFACVNVCHQGAIVASANENGFYRPRIVTDRCVNCGLCFNICPVLTPRQKSGFHQEAYVCKNNSDELRRKSSSGALFSALADIIIAKGGVVYGVKMDNSIVAVFSSSESENGIDAFKGSKYVQAYVGNSFRDVKKSLVCGKPVLFTGTPCQVAGLKNFLRKDYPNLFTLDFLCHGVPSPKTFSKNVKEWEQKEHDEIVSYHFRDKLKSWNLFNTRIAFRKGRIMTAFSRLQDSYFQLFLFNFGLQEACYHCQYTKRDRVSDITMADYWKECSQLSSKKIPYDDKGLSLVIINSKKGSDLFREVSSVVTSSALNYDEVIKKNKLLRTPFQKPADNDVFWSEIMKGTSIHDLASKLLPPTRISLTEKLIMRYGSNPIIRLVGKIEYRYNKYFIQKK